MRRLLIVGLAGVILFGVGRALWRASDVPTFRPGPAPRATLAPLSLNAVAGGRAFEGGRAWVTTGTMASEPIWYLLDLDRGRAVGQLTGARPIFSSADGAQLLCLQRGSSHRGNVWDRARRALERISGGRLRFEPHREGNPFEMENVLWILDLARNSAVRLTEARGLAISIVPSPSRRLGYVALQQRRGTVDLLVNLEAGTARTLAEDPEGWWDDNRLVIHDAQDNLVLWEAESGTRSALLNWSTVEEFLSSQGLSPVERGGWGSVGLMVVWNGQAYDFYLVDQSQGPTQTDSFLVRIQRPGGSLSLVSRRFEPGGQLDPSGRYNVFSGHRALDLVREGAKGDISSVYLRDLKEDQERPLLEKGDPREFSAPAFYGESIVYIRSNALWRVDLQGTNRVRLFP